MKPRRSAQDTDFTLSIDDVRSEAFPKGDFRLSSNSVYRDRKWNFHEPSKARQNSASESKLALDWDDYIKIGSAVSQEHMTCARRRSHDEAAVSEGVVEEIRRVSLIYREAPHLFALRGRAAGKTKPATLVPFARTMLVFFTIVDEVRLEALEKLDLASFHKQARSIADVRFAEIELALERTSDSDGPVLRKGLRFLCSVVMKGKFLGGEVQWNDADVSTLEFRKSKKRDDFERLMPNALFRFLSNTTCDDVSGFLQLLGLPRLDLTTSPAMPDFANQPG